MARLTAAARSALSAPLCLFWSIVFDCVRTGRRSALRWWRTELAPRPGRLSLQSRRASATILVLDPARSGAMICIGARHGPTSMPRVQMRVVNFVSSRLKRAVCADARSALARRPPAVPRCTSSGSRSPPSAVPPAPRPTWPWIRRASAKTRPTRCCGRCWRAPGAHKTAPRGAPRERT